MHTLPIMCCVLCGCTYIGCHTLDTEDLNLSGVGLNHLRYHFLAMYRYVCWDKRYFLYTSSFWLQTLWCIPNAVRCLSHSCDSLFLFFWFILQTSGFDSQSDSTFNPRFRENKGENIIESWLQWLTVLLTVIWTP